MKNYAISGSPREVADDGPNSEIAEFEQDRFNRLVNLQSELFDLIVNTGVGKERLKSVIGNIKDSFFADGAILVSFARETDGQSGKYICSTDGVEQATIDEFLAVEKSIPPVGKFGTVPCDDGSTDALLQGTFWAETINDIEDDCARAGIVLLFRKECEPTAGDRLALKSISPLVRLITDAAGNEDALKSANDRFSSLASTIRVTDLRTGLPFTSASSGKRSIGFRLWPTRLLRLTAGPFATLTFISSRRPANHTTPTASTADGTAGATAKRQSQSAASR